MFCIAPDLIFLLCASCPLVGGLKSPWREEYREPRHLPWVQSHTLPDPPQTAGQMPETPVSLRPFARSPSPPFDHQGPGEKTHLTTPSPQKERLQPWDSPPRNIKRGSWRDRRTATLEEEFQQLELGNDGAAHKFSSLKMYPVGLLLT